MAKRGIEAVLSRSMSLMGVVSMVKVLNSKRQAFTILLYHDIGSEDEGFPTGISVRPEHFETHMMILSEYFSVLTMGEVLHRLEMEEALPDNTVVISFDGCYRGNYEFAFPILKKYGLRADVYITTGHIDGQVPWDRLLNYVVRLAPRLSFGFRFKNISEAIDLTRGEAVEKNIRHLHRKILQLDPGLRPLAVDALAESFGMTSEDALKRLFPSWDQVKQMVDKGVADVGSHGITHRRLTDLPAQEAWQELVGSKARIEEKLGVPVKVFCYPDGVFSDSTKQATKKAGYAAALAVTDERGNKGLNTPATDRYAYRRIVAANQGSQTVFVMQITGIRDFIVTVGRKALGRVARA